MGRAGQMPRLHARRVRARYLVARNHPEPESVRLRLDGAARSSLVDVGRVLTNAVDDDESLWFIRRLEVELPVDAAWDQARIAATWARHISGALRTVFAHGADGDSVVRFADRAEYVSRFLTELARGTAWSRWHFGSFAGLRPLPASAAIRSVIVTEPDVSLRALLTLAPVELQLVVATLSAADALHAARGLARDTVNTPVLNDVRHAMRAIASRRIAGEERTTLYACVECARAGARLTSAHLSTSRAMVRFLNLMSCSPESRANAIREAIANSRIATIARLASLGDADILAPLFEVPLQTLAEIATPDDTRDSGREDDAGRKATPFGGLFLILPRLVELRIESAVGHWPDCGGAQAANLLRFLVALATASGDVRRDWHDPVARAVMGIPPTLELEHLATWVDAVPADEWNALSQSTAQSSMGSADAEFLKLPQSLIARSDARLAIAVVGHQALRRFAEPLVGFGRSSAAHLFANFLDVRASVEEHPTHRVVRLSNPPLGLILRMAGVGRETLLLPWLHMRPLMLYLAEET